VACSKNALEQSSCNGYGGRKMMMYNICRGRTLRIAVGITALSFLLLLGYANAVSNYGSRSWLYIRDIKINN
jgi:hypothetical protein